MNKVNTLGKTVVLIDDEVGVALALRLLLQTLGFQVQAFNEPEKALDHIQQVETIDYILCDLRMPRLNGLQVLQKTKELRPEVPFFLMSGHAEELEQEEAIRLGAAGFLAKPFSPEEFLELARAKG